MAEISVKLIDKDPYTFDVTVVEKDSSSNHKVTMKEDFYNSLETDTSPEDVVKKSFEFLLERESKESILGSFDVEVIKNYFPDYSEKVKSF